jgi:hypothetical protein
MSERPRSCGGRVFVQESNAGVIPTVPERERHKGFDWMVQVHRHFRPAVLLTLLALSLGACLIGGDDAGDAAKQRLTDVSERKYAEVWDMLHPAQQELVSQEQFVSCGQEGESSRSPEISDVKVIGEEIEQRDVAGVGSVESHIIELEWRQGEDVRRAFFDMIEDDGDWHWVLGQDALDAYSRGECPR